MSADVDEAARRDAVAMLEHRALSRAELRAKLHARGHDEPACDRVLESLGAAGLVDDRALGESIVRLELRRLPAGAALLEAKLARRGIGPETAASVVREALRGRRVAEDADAVARKRVRTLPRTLPPEVARRRLLGVLSRRGFEAEDALGAVERVLGSGGDAADGGG